MNHTPFTPTDAGLLAQNEAVALLLSPVHSALVYDGESLVEETTCNCLVRSNSHSNIQLYIDNQPAETLGFLSEGHTLWGRIDTGDRPGHIQFRIQSANRDILRASLHVRPSKLDYETDYHTMQSDLEHICRRLLYVLPDQARIATQSDNRNGDALDFFQLLDRLVQKLSQTCRAILNQPNRQSVRETITRPADRATGRDPDALIHFVRTPSTWTDRQDPNALRLPNQKIGIASLRESRWYSTTNTRANRHLIAQLHKLRRRTHALAQRLQNAAQAHQLHALSTQLQHILHNPVLNNIPPAQPSEGRHTHLDARYQQAFVLLRNLNRALAPCLGGPFDLSYRDTPTLYEYWTWFTVVHTLLDMGFSPTSCGPLFHLTDRGLVVSPTQGEPSAIHLQHSNTHVRCLYNLTYTQTSGRALTHDVRPDIVLDVHTPSGSRSIHAFDAKYRREQTNNCWAPLRDDIDKMHAYRDAIGQVTPEAFQHTLKSAIVLFPAPMNPAYQSHPFYKSLPNGIGGLPLLPGDPNTHAELRAHLKRCLST